MYFRFKRISEYLDCSVNLDGLTGNYPPLLLQGHQFIYPTSENQEGQRTIDIGKNSLYILLLKTKRRIKL